MRQAIAVPNLVDDPAAVVDLAVRAERAGWDGFFLWDHVTWSDGPDGPPVLDPWVTLGAVAQVTSRVRIGTMITPVSRRRPWQLARETATLDRLSGGRVVLGVGLGSPAYGDFGRFGEPTESRERALLLDEGLAVLAGLWTGERFSYAGKRFTVADTTFTPAPVQRPRIPVWVGGIWPNPAPLRRAARWDGAVPLTYGDTGLTKPTPEVIAAVRDVVEGHRPGATADGYDLVVWSHLTSGAEESSALLPAYADAGATWFIETAWPHDGWWAAAQRRVDDGPALAG